MNDSKTSSRGEAESLYACVRLGAALLLMTIGGAAMYGVVVALPALQAEFGVSRASRCRPCRRNSASRGRTRRCRTR